MPTEEELAEWEAFLTAENVPLTPVQERFRYASFVSTSRGRSLGRGRKPREEPRRRVRWVEIELIADTWEPARPLRYRTAERFPFDVKATEVYQNPDAESERLREEIRRDCLR